MTTTLPQVIKEMLEAKGNEAISADTLYWIFYPSLVKDPELPVKVNLGLELMTVISEEMARHNQELIIKSEIQANRRQELATKVEGNNNPLISQKLLSKIESTRSILQTSGGPDELHKLDCSLVSMYEALKDGDRDIAAVFAEPEVWRYDKEAGALLSKCNTELYVTSSGDLTKIKGSPRDGEDVMEKITAINYPVLVTPYLAFVHYSKTLGFHAADIRNDTACKLIESSMFKRELPYVKTISKVPILYHSEDSVDIITGGYHEPSKSFISGTHEGYEFLDLETAKGIIRDHFIDVNFMSESDEARAIAALILPAMNNANLLMGDRLPITCVEGDQEGSGKGMLVKLLTWPYVDSVQSVTQKDRGSAGSLEEDIANLVLTGNFFITLDNLKPRFNEKIFSSPYLESFTAEDSISGRVAFKGSHTIDPRGVSLYSTTNGITFSRDLADRSYFVKIRKNVEDYKYTVRPLGSVEAHVKGNRHTIMSAIFTIIRDWINRDKPTIACDPHRFNKTARIISEITTNTFGLCPVTVGHADHKERLSDPDMATFRTICFALRKANSLEVQLDCSDIAIACDSVNQPEAVGVPVGGILDIGDGTMDIDTKQHVLKFLGRLFSRATLFGRLPRKADFKTITFEEFTITRTLAISNGNKRITYLFELTRKN